ncbi:MAG: hypothetical protein AAF614_00875 [Chloroflexota bacterium]
MSKQKKDANLAANIRVQLNNLRQQGSTGFSRPPISAQLYNDLGHGTKQSLLHGEDFKMVAVVLSDALKGVDIFKVYPDFCRQMMADPELLELFSEAIDIIEATKTGEFIPDMTTQPEELQFLQQKPRSAQPMILQKTVRQWEVVWQQTVSFLETLFFKPTPVSTVATRRLNVLADGPQLDLISSDFVVDGTKLKVILQAHRPATQPEVLHLSVWAFVADLAQAMDKQLSLRAQLRWGSYDETVMIPSNSGQAQFPPLLLTQIFDESYTRLTAELYLTITNDS